MPESEFRVPPFLHQESRESASTSQGGYNLIMRPASQRGVVLFSLGPAAYCLLRYHMSTHKILAILLVSAGMTFAQEIPPGTALPVLLSSKLDAAKTKPGQQIAGRLAQDVPLPSGIRIPEGSQVRGQVLEVRPAASGSGSQLALKFDRVHTKRADFPVTTGLRAIASLPEVVRAQEPDFKFGCALSPANWTTEQIGGSEAVYRGGGHVMAGNEIVGEPVWHGVVGRFRPSACPGENDRKQALWLFATTACGAYGFADLRIANPGWTAPVGQIVLASKGNVQVFGGSGLLLVTLAPAAQK
jgi:hypothetical protein